MPTTPSRTLARILALVVAATALVGIVGLGQTSAQATDMDCADFPTQAAAQAFFAAAGPGDPHLLDGDGDGLACETLPCPCATTLAPPPPAVTPTPSPTAQPTATPTSTPTLPASPTPPRREKGNVVRVADGDTLTVRLPDGRAERVRLIGIDSPESTTTVECGGKAASRSMKRLAPIGSRVVIVSDPTQDQADRYGRLLRYVQRNGRDLGMTQIRRGLARAYVYDKPFQRTKTYKRAERRARSTHRGNWRTCRR